LSGAHGTASGAASGTHGSYVPFIDGLRAIAVLAVITYHLHAAWLPGGFTGVDIFFVISGYVVSASVAPRGPLRIGAFLGYFYARRLFRIGPALIACLLATSLAAILFIPYSWLSGTVQNTGTKAFFGLSNFTLASTDNDYFSPRVDFNPFTHSWSLGVEEQFYLIFPWLFLPWLHFRRRLSLSLTAIFCLLSLVWAWHLGTTNPNRAFYMLTSRFWELAAGMLLLQAQIWRPQHAAASPACHRLLTLRAPGVLTLRAPGVLTLCAPGAWISAALLAAGLLITAPASTPFPGGLLPVLGTVGLLACLAGGAPSLIRGTLETPPLRFIGKISYSLYLWHWPVFVLFRWTSGLDTPAEYGCALVLVFALATLSYYLIETPPRRLLPRLRTPRYVPILIGLAAIGLGSALASGLWALQPRLSLSTVTQHSTDWYPDKLPPEPNTACQIQSSSFKIPGMRVQRFTGTGCAPGQRLSIEGDSHAAAYTAMARLLALREGADVYLYTTGGCSFISLLYPAAPACQATSHAAMHDILAKARPGDVLFLPALRLPRLTDQFASYGLAAAQAQAASASPIRAAEIQAALPMLRAFAARHVSIVLEAPTPVFNAVTFRCADWFDRENPICAGGPTIPRATIEQLRTPILQGFAELQTAIPGIKIWDPTQILCPGAVCSEYENGRPLFFDADHLSGYANQLLEPDFAAIMK
jgi:peptidoglycan/LPS O-acetylase OafA/YrhL